MRHTPVLQSDAGTGAPERVSREISMHADLILTHGRIYTVDKMDSIASALAVRGGRVEAVGSNEDMLLLARAGTKVVDLGGRAVLPGLNDAHLHLLSFGQSLREVDLKSAATVEDAIRMIAAATGTATPGEWISGSGWDLHRFGRLPTREELDHVSPHNPVLMASRDLHSLWVNSLALQAAGISAETPDPDDGEIVRETSSGEPSGILREAARAAVFRAVPPPSPEDVRVYVRTAAEVALSKGLTSLQTFESAETFEAAQVLARSGQLGVRLCCHLWKDGLDQAIDLGLRSGFGDEQVRVGHLKLFLDGALGSRTALMLEPYTGTQDRGIQTLSRNEFLGYVVRAAEAGIATAVHAIGDAANRIAIEVFEETARVWKTAGLRQRIEHVQLLAPGDAERLGRLGVIASMQPIHATSDWEVAERHWAGRTSTAYAWRSVLDSGAPLAFGSDCPVEPIDPLLGLYAAITRRNSAGLPEGGWHPEQTLSPFEALRAYTIGPAYATGEEQAKGSLETGKFADFVVLSRDPFEEEPETLLETGVDATVVGGRVLFGSL